MQDPIIVAYYSTIKKAITKKFILVDPKDKHRDIAELASIYGKYVKTPSAEILAMFSISTSSTASATSTVAVGGVDEDLFADLDLDTIPEEDSLTKLMKSTQTIRVDKNHGLASLLPSFEIFSKKLPNEIISGEIKVYPFDKVYDLAMKLGIVTGIPYYRLHIDYIDQSGHVQGTYKLFAGGPYDTGIISYAQKDNSVSLGNGINVDKYIYDIKSDTKVYVSDTFNIVDGVRYIMISDLNELMSLAPLDDQYKMDLVYYGIVLKYWPQMTLEVFNEYIRNESGLPHRYPELARNPEYIKSQYSSERHLLGNIDIDSGSSGNSITTSIGRCLVSGAAPGPLNLRNIFDSLTTNDITSKIHIPEIHYFVRDGAKSIQLTKIHHGTKARGVPNQQVLRAGITVLIMKGSEVMYFSLHANGKWYFKVTFAEEDFMTFETIEAFVIKYIEPVVSLINKIGLKGSPAGRINIKDLNYEHISAGLFWKKILTDAQFKDLIKVFDEYIGAGIIGQYDIINTIKDSRLYIFKKGTYQFDGTLIDRVLIKAGKGELSNQFVYLVNPLIRSKWMELYYGRVIRLVHRSSDINIEIQDAQQNEFLMFKALMTHILKRSGIKESGSINVRNNLEKSKEQDPVLFNLKKAGYPVVYARICQKKMQPIVYQESEFNGLSDVTKRKLTKYKNFTYNKPAYYMCPGNTYKYLNFIAGVHPAGYCLPCCFKTPVSDRERKAKQIYESCTSRFKGPDDLVSDSRHILATNKILDSGRIGHVPELFKKVTPRDTYMLGVTQYSRSVFCPMLSIGAMIVQEIRGKFIPKSQDPVDYFVGELYQRLRSKGKVFMPELDPEDLMSTLGGTTRPQNESVDWNNVITRALLVFWGVTVIYCNAHDIDLPSAGSVTNKVVIVIKRMYTKESSVNNAGPAWYPVCKADQNYFKTGITNGIIFGLEEELDILAESLDHYDREQESHANKVPGADAIVKYLTATGQQTKYTKYIGRKNKVYGISFNFGGKDLFIVTNYSDYSSGKEKISFDYPDIVNDPAVLKKFFDSFELKGHINFEVTKLLRSKKTKKFVGVIVNDIQITHTPVEESPFMRRGWTTDSRIVEIDYDLNDVNRALLRGSSNIDDINVSRGLYKYYLYDLILMQVTKELQKLRDPEIGSRIVSAFSGSTNVPAVLKSLGDIVPRGSKDFDKIVDVIAASKKNKTGNFASMMRDIQFSWDIKYMKSFLTQEKIQKFIDDSCVRGQVSIKSFPNVYEPCSDTKQDYCNSQNRLIVDCDDKFWASIPKLIVNDLTNNIKGEYIMDRLYYDNIIDEYNYNVSPNEDLFIKKK